MSGDNSLTQPITYWRAFILHKEKMSAVFRTIQIDSSAREVRSIALMEALKPLDKHLSTCAFYWIPFRDGSKGLFSKGWNYAEAGEWSCAIHCGDKRSYLINKVLDYYTDGVRAIGAME